MKYEDVREADAIQVASKKFDDWVKKAFEEMTAVECALLLRLGMSKQPVRQGDIIPCLRERLGQRNCKEFFTSADSASLGDDVRWTLTRFGLAVYKILQGPRK